MRLSCHLILAVSMMLALSACVSPSPDMMGSMRREVTVEGIGFTVFHDYNTAEVVRMGGYMSMKERNRVPSLMPQAVEMASGCRAIPGSMTTRLPGDTGVARFDLDC